MRRDEIEALAVISKKLHLCLLSSLTLYDISPDKNFYSAQCAVISLYLRDLGNIEIILQKVIAIYIAEALR